MLISLNENDPLPIYLQIVRQIKEQILAGELAGGDELPSVRELGDALGISLHTARSAYQTLSDDGLLRIRLGKRARVAPQEGEGSSEPAPEAIAERLRDVVVDALLHGGSPEQVRDLLDRQIDELAARRMDAMGRKNRQAKEG